MDNPHDITPEQMQASLDRSLAQIAAGQTVSGEAVLEEIRQSIARMQAKAEPRQPARRKA